MQISFPIKEITLKIYVTDPVFHTKEYYEIIMQYKLQLGVTNKLGYD